jgi:hypothetical protein
MATKYINQVGYGLTSALPVLAPYPINAKRAPLTSDTGYPIGQVWIYGASNAAYILTSIVSNSATWESLSGGAGSFGSLTVTPGPVSLTGTTTINTTGTATTSIGSAAGGNVTVLSPSVDIDSSAAGSVAVGDSITTGTIDIGTGLTTGSMQIGNHTSTNSVAIESGSGGVNFTSGGLLSMDFLTATQASPTATAVINGRQCYAVFTGFTTASGAKQVFIITNSIITNASSIIVTAINLGSNDAEMTVTRVVPGSGTVSITLTNNGAAALNGDVHITMLVLD